ncbi:uncharacterized protein LOC141666209 [Apium graveolens]|uniref:uncharacterized protein LOC141666209 n=1 Tax=Apium graveolens TaxID=4045 RepID=UPI003D7BF4F4
MARSCLKEMKLPSKLWGEAIKHVVYLLNRLPTRALSEQTPYEAWFKEKPNIEQICVFGCIVHMRIPSCQMSKLDDRSIKVVNLGKEPGTKAYHLYDPVRNKVYVSRDVILEEDKKWVWSDKGEAQKAGEEVTQESDGETKIENEVMQESHVQSLLQTEVRSENYDGSEPPRKFRVVTDIYNNTEAIELDEELLLMGVDEPTNYKKDNKEVEWKKAMMEGDDVLIVAVYLDNLLITGSNKLVIETFKKQMSRVFEMTDLGELSFYLGNEVQQGNGFIELKQAGYVKKVLERAGMVSCNISKNPMDLNMQISKDEGGKKVYGTTYNPALGCCKAYTQNWPKIRYSRDVANTSTYDVILSDSAWNVERLSSNILVARYKADFLTKALVTVKFERMQSLLGVKNLV